MLKIHPNLNLHTFVSSAYATLPHLQIVILLPAKEIIILYPWDICIPIPKRYHSFLHIAWTDHSLCANIILCNMYKSDRFSYGNCISLLLLFLCFTLLHYVNICQMYVLWILQIWCAQNLIWQQWLQYLFRNMTIFIFCPMLVKKINKIKWESQHATKYRSNNTQNNNINIITHKHYDIMR